jgi:hypothetical protein
MAALINGKALSRPFLSLILVNLMHLSMAGAAESLPVDLNGKVEYKGTIYSDISHYPDLSNHIVAFLNTLSVPDQLTAEVEASADKQTFKHQVGFYLYQKPALTWQIDGVILADVTVKINEGKLDYCIHNFRFINYTRNRLGKFTPKSTKKYPLELYYPGSKNKTWQIHFVEIDRKISDLEQKMRVDLVSLRKND